MDAEPATDAHRRLAEVARVVLQHVVADDAPADVAAAVTADLERVATRFAPPGGPGRPPEGEGQVRTGDRMAVHPFTGPANPLAPPLVVTAGGEGQVRVTVTYGVLYEGPPGRVHGGFIAAGFDVALGRAVGDVIDGAVFTGTLTVCYLRPTPILEPVCYEAEVTGIDGRKIAVVGRLVADGQVTCEAEGIWIRAAP